VLLLSIQCYDQRYSDDPVMGVMMEEGCAGVWCDIFDRGWINGFPCVCLLVVHEDFEPTSVLVFLSLNDH
jgi:hypothetical protein